MFWLSLVLGLWQHSGDWNPLWTRVANAGSSQVRGDTLILEHTGAEDWSLDRTGLLDANAGDVFEIRAELRVTGDGEAGVCATTYSGQTVRNWTAGYIGLTSGPGWQTSRTVVVASRGVDAIRPRIVGHRPARIEIRNFSARRTGRHPVLPLTTPPVRLRSNELDVAVSPATGEMTVVDRRNRHVWRQSLRFDQVLGIGTRVEEGGRRLVWEGVQVETGEKIRARIAVEGDEIAWSANADGPIPDALHFPAPFASTPETELILPMNMGILYPARDPEREPQWMAGYGGHGLSMAFWGVVEKPAAMMAIVETPDDFVLHVERRDNLFEANPLWQGQKGRFAYERRLRFVFFETGDHVRIAKRYRIHARERGLLRTLAEKRRQNPNVDLLVGSANVWSWDWDGDPVPFAEKLKEAGIERVLWSQKTNPTAIRRLREMGFLPGRYDIYQDVMDPSRHAEMTWVHPDWVTAAWPRQLVRDRSGRWIPGWRVEDKRGNLVPCGVVCDREILPYAEERISTELRTHPYLARFIDTTTASEYRECWDSSHPMTRSDSRRYRMDLLRLVSEKFGLVTGSETGHEAAVPYLHYFEGMTSLGPYRVPDAGTHMNREYDHVPEVISRFQLDHRQRIPLWQLVYGDCVASSWYWGDYSNKFPEVWRIRDLFDALYGTMPLYGLRPWQWERDRAEVVRSYRATVPIVRAVAYQEMTGHEFLTADRSVQRTTWSDGSETIANFGKTPYIGEGWTIPPGEARHRTRHGHR